jgi:putative transposase
MTNYTTKPDSLQPAADMAVDLFDNWFDPIESEVRARSRQFIGGGPEVAGPRSK